MKSDNLVFERQLTERERFFEESHQRFRKEAERIDNMILTVVKAQIIVERFMISLLEVNGRDPKHFYFTSQKIKECRENIDPPEVGQPIWELLSLCTLVRNELVHSLDTREIKRRCDRVRKAYLTIADNDRRKQGIIDMDDTQMITSAIYDCGSLIVVATDAKDAENKARRAD
ncbi:hypothetical protein LOC51_23955 [Rubrivivax sp. JA1024]|nr:hypothetical protein [Rubrivivax sp. JA1024]